MHSETRYNCTEVRVTKWTAIRWIIILIVILFHLIYDVLRFFCVAHTACPCRHRDCVYNVMSSSIPISRGNNLNNYPHLFIFYSIKHESTQYSSKKSMKYTRLYEFIRTLEIAVYVEPIYTHTTHCGANFSLYFYLISLNLHCCRCSFPPHTRPTTYPSLISFCAINSICIASQCYESSSLFCCCSAIADAAVVVVVIGRPHALTHAWLVKTVWIAQPNIDENVYSLAFRLSNGQWTNG